MIDASATEHLLAAISELAGGASVAAIVLVVLLTCWSTMSWSTDGAS